MDNNIIDKLVAESIVNRLAEGELDRAHLEARYTLTLAELQAFKAVLEYSPALKELFDETLKELFDETQAEMKGAN